MWKSRIDKLPPAQFFADLAAYLEAAFPGARMDRQTLEQLYPFFVEEWRSGQSAHDTAKATCACDGKNIVPSLATSIFIPRRSVRPPAGAQRGQLVTPEELRDPAPLHSARVALEVAKRDVEHLEAEQARLISDMNRATKERQRTKIEGQIAKVNRELNEAAHRVTTAQALVTQAEEQAPYKRATTIVAPPKAPRTARKPPAQARAGSTPKKGGGLDYTPRAFPAARAPDGPAPGQEDKLAELGLVERANAEPHAGEKQAATERPSKAKRALHEEKAPCDDCKKKRGPKKTAPKADTPSSTPTIPNLEELANLFAEADLLDKKG